MFAVSAGQQESKPSQKQSSKSPARLDLRSLASHTKNERIDVDLESRLSRKEPLLETTLSPKRRRTFHTSQSLPCFSRLRATHNEQAFLQDKNLELEHPILEKKKEKELSDVVHSSHESKNTVSRTPYGNFPEKQREKCPGNAHTKFSSKETFISNDSSFGSRESSNGCLDEERKDATPSSPQERIPNHPDGSKIPRYFHPYYLMPDPRDILGCRQLSGEHKESEEKVSSGHVSSGPSSTPVSPIQTIYVPSAGFFPWGQINQGGQTHLPDKGPSVAFVPFEVLPCSTNERMFPYGFPSINRDRTEASRYVVLDRDKIDPRNKRETNDREEEEENRIQDKRSKGESKLIFDLYIL